MKKAKIYYRKSADKMNFRTVSVRAGDAAGPASLDEEMRSVEVVGATEEPVEVFDYERWEVVPEILLMEGAELPKNRQIVLIDDHMRSGTASVLGSYREMRTEDSLLLGRAHFSSAAEAKGPFTKVKEGHLTDFSVGYRVIKSVWVPDGEKAVIKGRSFTGPVKVTTRWRPKELSITPIGADELAKVRADQKPGKQTKQLEDNVMDPKLKKFLEKRGLEKNATEEQAWEFLRKLELPQKEPGGNQPAGAKQQRPEDEIREEAIRAEQERYSEISSMCDKHNVSDEMRRKFIDERTPVDKARKAVMDWIVKNNETTGGTGYRAPAAMIADERDKFRAAAEDALLIRTGRHDLKLVPEKPADGARDLVGYAMIELARHCLMLAGQSTGGSKREMIGRALTTSDFPYLLANVANKSLFAGWDAASETWQQWCGTGSVSDFKTHSKPRASEVDDLEEIGDHGRYRYGERSDAQEQYQIATYGKIYPITRQAIINDDLGALTDIAAHGEAASRKVGDVAYAVLTANSAMGDAVALFHASHNNLLSAAAPGTSSIAAAILAMKTQKDIRNLRRLNIRPGFFIAPAALEGNAEVFFNSFQYADEASAGTPDEAYATTRKNPYAGSYFDRVYDPRLDDDSATAWYLAGPQGKTVVVYFLDGDNRPYTESKNGWTVDGVELKVRIDCGAKAMDWRGMTKNPGA